MNIHIDEKMFSISVKEESFAILVQIVSRGRIGLERVNL